MFYSFWKHSASTLVRTYWQILENSSKNVTEISVFRVVTQTDFWKTHPVFFRNFNFRGMSLNNIWKIHPSIFCEYLFSFCKISAKYYRGRSLTDFQKTNPSIFCEYLFSCCRISGHELDRFMENSSKYGRAFQKSVLLMLRYFTKTDG